MDIKKETIFNYENCIFGVRFYDYDECAMDFCYNKKEKGLDTNDTLSFRAFWIQPTNPTVYNISRNEFCIEGEYCDIEKATEIYTRDFINTLHKRLSNGTIELCFVNQDDITKHRMIIYDTLIKGAYDKILASIRKITENFVTRMKERHGVANE